MGALQCVGMRGHSRFRIWSAEFCVWAEIRLMNADHNEAAAFSAFQVEKCCAVFRNAAALFVCATDFAFGQVCLSNSLGEVAEGKVWHREQTLKQCCNSLMVSTTLDAACLHYFTD